MALPRFAESTDLFVVLLSKSKRSDSGTERSGFERQRERESQSGRSGLGRILVKGCSNFTYGTRITASYRTQRSSDSTTSNMTLNGYKARRNSLTPFTPSRRACNNRRADKPSIGLYWTLFTDVLRPTKNSTAVHAFFQLFNEDVSLQS